MLLPAAVFIQVIVAPRVGPLQGLVGDCGGISYFVSFDIPHLRCRLATLVGPLFLEAAIAAGLAEVADQPLLRIVQLQLDHFAGCPSAVFAQVTLE